MDSKRWVRRASARVWAGAIIILNVVMLLSCAPPDPIRIGFIGGASGRVADLGIAGRDAVLLAIEPVSYTHLL